MFTGIVEETGQVVTFKPEAEGWELIVSAKAAMSEIAHGDSIAVNGCCFTVTRFDLAAGRMHFDVLEETRRLTNFSSLQAGSLVNLERSLRFGGKVSGHFVTGHIDATGEVEIFELRGKDYFLRIKVMPELMRHVVLKGSIAIDGISLTVAEVADESLAVWIIPTTLTVTNLSEKKAGDLVNLEFDLLGKHVEKLMLARL